MNIRELTSALILLFCLIAPVNGSQSAPKLLGRLLSKDVGYNPHELNVPLGINNLGQVVGRAAVGSSANRSEHAFLSVDGHMRDLGVLPNYSGGSCAYAINENCEIVGCSGRRGYDDAEDAHAFLWKNGKLTDIGTLGGSYSRAHSINKDGVVAGESKTASGEVHAFIFANGKMKDIGVINGYKYYRAAKINDSGCLVGSMSFDAKERSPHAFRYQNGKIEDLGDFGGEWSVAYALNGTGDIVGDIFSSSDKVLHAFIYSNGVFTDLSKMLDANGDTYARAISNRGDVVVAVGIGRGEKKNLIVRNGSVFEPENELEGAGGYSVDYINGINDVGQIICIGDTPEGTAGFIVNLPAKW